MKKIIFMTGLLVLCASISFAQMPKFGVGAFGGINIPVAQDDQAGGSVFGVKARLKLLPIIVVEPNVSFGKWGAPDPIDGIDLGIDGSKITSFGIDFTLGGLPGKAGFKPYVMAGVASYKIKNDDTGYENSKLGIAGGLGVAFGLSPLLDIDIRGKAVIAPQEEGSKKAIWILGGINYYFGGY